MATIRGLVSPDGPQASALAASSRLDHCIAPAFSLVIEVGVNARDSPRLDVVEPPG